MPVEGKGFGEIGPWMRQSLPTFEAHANVPRQSEVDQIRRQSFDRPLVENSEFRLPILQS